MSDTTHATTDKGARADILRALAQPDAICCAVTIAYGDHSRISFVAGASPALLAATQSLRNQVAEDLGATNSPSADQSACWIWCDLDGEGDRWHLALRGAVDQPSDELLFPLAAFSDAAENYDDCPTLPIAPPPRATKEG